jgi:hypothetical protein
LISLFKNFVNWIVFYLSPLLAVVYLSNLLLGPAHYRINDDIIISWLVSGTDSYGENTITVHTSIIYGYILRLLSVNYVDFEWHGILQIVSLIIILSVLNFFISRQKNIPISIKYGLIGLIYVYIFWYTANPTFTMTSITLGITGLILLLAAFSNEEKYPKFLYFFASVLAQIFSFLIRPDGYFFAVLICSALVVFYLILSRSTKNVFLLGVNTITLLIVVFIDNQTLKQNLEDSRAWSKYYGFHKYFYQIKTNPAEIDLYELIARGEIEDLKWDNVDALILQTNSFYDQEIFSEEALAAGVSQIEDSFGFQGIIKRGANYTFKRTWSYLVESKTLLASLGFLLIANIFLKIPAWKRLLTFTAGFTPLFLTFLYLGGSSRLPLRVHLPALVFFFIFWAIFILLITPKLNLISKMALLVGSIFITANFIFFSNNIFEVKENNLRLSENLNKNKKIMQEIDSEGIFIGQIAAFSMNTALAYQKTTHEDIAYLTSGWMTFSPPWYNKLYSLDLLDNDPYLALASQAGVYWVSDAYTAQVLNMYMNNHEIYRKNLCLLETISYGMSIYTFQSEEECSN